jgi:hypothetical protein
LHSGSVTFLCRKQQGCRSIIVFSIHYSGPRILDQAIS